jgi:hypothetical protein
MKIRAKRRLWNWRIGRTRREHMWYCPRVTRWSGRATRGVTGVAAKGITQARLTGLAKTATRTGKQIGLARLLRLAEIAACIDGQIRLAGLTGIAGLAR